MKCLWGEKKMKLICPECGAELSLDEKPVLNEILECPECGAQLVVKEVKPEVVLEVLEDVGEDWGE